MPDAVGVEVVDAAMRSLLRRLKEAGSASNAMSSEKGPYYYYARVGEFPFFIGIGEARSDIMAEWGKRLAVYGIAVAAIVALMILLARLLGKNFARSAELAARFVAMESTSDMIVIADLDGRAEYVNPSFERTTGLSKEQTIGSRQAIFGLEEAEADAALSTAAAGEGWRGEITAIRADGVELVEEVTIAPVPGPGGEPVRLVAVLRDITERRRLQERLERLAHYDSLTALPNRALFFDRLEGAVARAKREERRFALLFVDLDGFKAINDHYGHDAGDYLLFEIAAASPRGDQGLRHRGPDGRRRVHHPPRQYRQARGRHGGRGQDPQLARRAHRDTFGSARVGRRERRHRRLPGRRARRRGGAQGRRFRHVRDQALRRASLTRAFPGPSIDQEK